MNERRLLIAVVFNSVHLVENSSSKHHKLKQNSVSFTCQRKQVSRCSINCPHKLTCQMEDVTPFPACFADETYYQPFSSRDRFRSRQQLSNDAFQLNSTLLFSDYLCHFHRYPSYKIPMFNFIPMRTRIEILAPRKSTGFMKMKRSENTTLASQKQSKAHSPHWYLQRREGSRNREGSSRTSLDSAAIDLYYYDVHRNFHFLVYSQLFTFALLKTTRPPRSFFF